MQRSLKNSEKLAHQIRSSIIEAVQQNVNNDAAKLLERDDALELVSILLQHFRDGGAKTAQKATTVSAGGVLKVPKPDRVAPGGLPQTLADVASRVAIIRGEFRGVDASQVPEQTSTKAVSEKASPATTKNEQETASNPVDTRTDDAKAAPKSLPSNPSLQPVVQRMMGTHVGTLQAKKAKKESTTRQQKKSKPAKGRAAKKAAKPQESKESQKTAVASG